MANDPWATATAYGVASGSGAFQSGPIETMAQLEKLWIQAGGDPNLAPQMAAIAKAESGGNPTSYNATQASGDQSFGLWQINVAPNANHDFAGQVTSISGGIFDPLQNAKDAVAIEKRQGLSNNSWSSYGGSSYESWLATAPSPSSPSVQNAVPDTTSTPAQSVISNVTTAPGALLGGVSSAISAWWGSHPIFLLLAAVVLALMAWAFIGSPNITVDTPSPLGASA
jgi:hypothetical protein